MSSKTAVGKCFPNVLLFRLLRTNGYTCNHVKVMIWLQWSINKIPKTLVKNVSSPLYSLSVPFGQTVRPHLM